MLLEKFSNYLRKKFKGELLRTLNCDAGIVLEYKSGYVELRDNEGHRRDLYAELNLKRYVWTLRASDGVNIATRPLYREQAMDEAKRLVGPVLYVDDSLKMIVCRSRNQN